MNFTNKAALKPCKQKESKQRKRQTERFKRAGNVQRKRLEIPRVRNFQFGKGLQTVGARL